MAAPDTGGIPTTIQHTRFVRDELQRALMYRSALVMDISLHYTFLYPRIQVPRSKRKARNPSRVFYLFFDVGPRPRRVRVPSRTS